MAWLLAAAWLPATSHCLLGAVGWLPDLCCEASHEHDSDAKPLDDHSDCDACTAVESGNYTFSKPSDFNFTFHADLAWEAPLHQPASATAKLKIPLTGRAPPDLTPRWAFHTRAAIPGRAPSRLA